MNIILDCFGGDNCPNAAVKGALIALEQNPDIRITLCGKENEIKSCLDGNNYDKERISIINASDVISNDEVPSLSIRRKKTASMVVALDNLANNQNYDAVVSSGNTGALLTGVSIIVKRIKGVTRASLSPIVPTMIDGQNCIIADGGANVDCTPEMLVEFAIMGEAYMRCVFGIHKPRVALLNNGAEEEKGNALTKETFKLLSNSGLNFIGNIEARDILSGIADVVVTDGFAGNMAIKSSEGMANAIFGLLKENIMNGGLRAKLGYLLLKPALRKIKRKLSSDSVGGGVFLGAKKVVVKAHGSSNEKAFASAIKTAKTMVESKVVQKIEEGISASEKNE